MRRPRLTALGLLLALGAACRAAPPCEPGYRWVEEETYEQVERTVCKTVADVKKVRKVVYATKDSPFCLRRAGCAPCRGPFDRKTLVKTEVVCDEPTTKCVTEKVVETVPRKVWRKVRCGPPGG